MEVKMVTMEYSDILRRQMAIINGEHDDNPW